MREDDESECLHTLKLLSAKAYAVDDVLTLISEVVHPCNHHLNTIKMIPFPSGKWSNDIDECRQATSENPTSDQTNCQDTTLEQESSASQNEDIVPTVIQSDQIPETYKQEAMTSSQSGDSVCDQCAEDRKNYKTYLIERLLEAVAEKKVELRDTYLQKVVAPPIIDDSSSTQVPADSLKQSPDKAFRLYLSETYSPPQTSPQEPSFMRVLAEPAIATRTYRSNTRPVYKTAFWWAKTTYILRPDLIRFCSGESIYVKFEGEEEKKNTLKCNQETDAKPGVIQSAQKLDINNQDVLIDSQGQRIERWRLANFNQLADAFKVLTDSHKNTEWFKRRCSDFNDYPAFKYAMRKKGARGAGNVALFDVLLIASHLSENRKIATDPDYFKPPHYLAYLKTRICLLHFLASRTAGDRH